MSEARVALVTAGAHGIGRAITDALHGSGWRVLVTTRNALSAPWPDDDRRLVWEGALRDAADAEAATTALVDRWGRLDLLVNNLGPFLERPLADTSPDEWQRTVESNLSIPFHLAALAVPHMRRQQSGTIINVGFTGAGRARGWRQRGAYAAAKSGVASLTRTLALEEAVHGIAVVMVSPSNIREADKEQTGAGAPGPRRGPTGADLARLVLFLADPASFYLSGNVIDLARRPRGWSQSPSS